VQPQLGAIEPGNQVLIYEQLAARTKFDRWRVGFLRGSLRPRPLAIIPAHKQQQEQ
jgi:hypothetical protein